jgi:hypothetical protein
MARRAGFSVDLTTPHPQLPVKDGSHARHGAEDGHWELESLDRQLISTNTMRHAGSCSMSAKNHIEGL